MKSVVLRTKPAVHIGPRDVTSGRISPVSRMRCRCIADAMQRHAHEGVVLDLVFRAVSMSSMW